MSIVKAEDFEGKRTIDLRGPDGNAYFLMGTAREWAKQLDWTPEAILIMLERMQSSDYEHLIEVFEDYWGETVTLLR